MAIQCLESAYDVSSSDVHLLPSKTLLEMYSLAVEGEPVKVTTDDPLKRINRSFVSNCFCLDNNRINRKLQRLKKPKLRQSNSRMR